MFVCYTGQSSTPAVPDGDEVSLYAGSDTELAEQNVDITSVTKEQLERDLQSTQKHAYASGTVRNFLCIWKCFLRFAIRFNITQWPITVHQICLFAQFLAYSFKSASSIRTYITAVCTLHVLTRVLPPSLKDIEWALTFKGLKKKLTCTVRRAKPLTPEILVDILGFLNLKKRTDLIFWATLLVGFFGMLRKSNLMPDSKKSFSTVRQLTRGHVSFRQGVVVIKVTWAKNLQHRERLVEIPLFPIPGSPLCPVNALKLVLSKSGKDKHPLFGSGKKVLLTYSMFQKKFKAVLKRAGYNEGAFSSHSMRRGGAGFAHRSGVPDSLIQIHGDWASDAYKTYLSYPLEVRAIVSLKMREKILNIKF